jgi:hypothetical protein
MHRRALLLHLALGTACGDAASVATDTTDTTDTTDDPVTGGATTGDTPTGDPPAGSSASSTGPACPANAPPEVPTIQDPLAGRIDVVPESLTIVASGFVDPDAGDAPGGSATRYDPAATTLTGTAASASSGTLAALRLPIFDASGGLLTELPLRDVRFTAIRPADGTRCVGLGLPSGGRFNECTSAWQTADATSPNGAVEGVLTVADARSVQITALATSLCNILAGSDCDLVPQAMWMRPPDATAGGAAGWRFTAEFAAVSARIP